MLVHLSYDELTYVVHQKLRLPVTYSIHFHEPNRVSRLEPLHPIETHTNMLECFVQSLEHAGYSALLKMPPLAHCYNLDYDYIGYGNISAGWVLYVLSVIHDCHSYDMSHSVWCMMGSLYCTMYVIIAEPTSWRTSW